MLSMLFNEKNPYGCLALMVLFLSLVLKAPIRSPEASHINNTHAQVFFM